MAFPDRHPCVETGLETQIRYQNDRIGFRANYRPSDFSSCCQKPLGRQFFRHRESCPDHGLGGLLHGADLLASQRVPDGWRPASGLGLAPSTTRTAIHRGVWIAETIPERPYRFNEKCPPSDFSSCPHKLANPETAMTLEQDPHAWQEGLSMRSNRQYSALRISS